MTNKIQKIVIIEVIIALVIILGLVGYKLVANNNTSKPTPTPTTAPNTPTPTVTQAPTLTPTPTPTPKPVYTPITSNNNVIPEADPKTYNFTHSIYIEKSKQQNYEPTYDMCFQTSDQYSDVEGVLTFRGNNYRNAPSYGTVDIKEEKLELVWNHPIGKIVYDGGMWPGVGWTGQPSIVKWPEQVRNQMNIKDTLKSKDLKEVIYATLDGKIYFIDLETGEPTREPINIGYPTKGSVSVDPRGYPLFFTGQGINRNETSYSTQRFRIFNLIDQTEAFNIYGIEEGIAKKNWGAFDSSGVLDKETDTFIQAGENGILYKIKLNTDYDTENGKISIDPELTKYVYKRGVFRDDTGIENSPAIYKNYLYCADNGGLLQCIDINTLEPIWIANVSDDTDSTIVIDEENGNPFIYTANEVDKLGKDKGTKPAYDNCYIRKFNGLTGQLVWEKPYRCVYDSVINGGALSTPIIGKNEIDNLVIYNIAKTTDMLHGKMVALDKSTGEEVWTKELTYYSWSSPVDVYTPSGKAYIIFCDYAGDMHLIDAKTGETKDTLRLGTPKNYGLNIEASPAVYNDMVVVGSYALEIFGVKIK